MASVVLADPSDSANYPAEWEDLDGAQITSVVHNVPSPLVKLSESYDNSTSPPTTTVRIEGVQHGMSYLVQCEITIGTGEKLNRQFILRGFNG